MTSRPSTVAPILVVLALVLVTLGAAYVGGYFWLGTRIGFNVTAARIYPEPWMAAVFEPAARVESWLTGIEVDSQYWMRTGD